MVRVRAAEAGDIPRLMEIAAHSATAALWTTAEYEKIFAPQQTPARVALVVEDNGVVAGFLVSSHLDDEWEIENIAVSGSARRRGLGSRMLGEFVDLVRARGGREIFLEVRESNRAARALYEKWAFIEAGRRVAYYDHPAEDALIFTFSLPR